MGRSSNLRSGGCITNMITPDAIRTAIQQSGNQFLLDWWGDQAPIYLQRIAGELEQFIEAYEGRFGERPDPLKLLEINPLAGAAFFQPDTLQLSTEMKTAVYRILLGAEIASVKFAYELGEQNDFQLELLTSDGQREIYVGKGSRDFTVLRHISSAEIGNRLQLQGYYALRSA